MYKNKLLNIYNKVLLWLYIFLYQFVYKLCRNSFVFSKNVQERFSCFDFYDAACITKWRYNKIILLSTLFSVTLWWSCHSQEFKYCLFFCISCISLFLFIYFFSEFSVGFFCLFFQHCKFFLFVLVYGKVKSDQNK